MIQVSASWYNRTNEQRLTDGLTSARRLTNPKGILRMATQSIPRSGVYLITCDPTGKFYIGASANIRKRWNLHRSQLRRGCHFNPYLQEAWGLYGPSAFKFTVLETVPSQKLLEREQVWLDQLDPDGDRSFNCSQDVFRPCLGRTKSHDARSRISEARSQAWVVTDPSGSEFRIKNLYQFCHEHDLNPSTMCAVANGKRNHHHGWKCKSVETEGVD